LQKGKIILLVSGLRDFLISAIPAIKKSQNPASNNYSMAFTITFIAIVGVFTNNINAADNC